MTGPKSLSLVLSALTLVAVEPALTDRPKTDESPLSIGITGTSPSDRAKDPTAILGSAKIQRLILEIAETPKSRAEIESVVSGEFFTLDDMVNVGLLREENDAYRIDFNLLRVADQKLILEVAEQSGRDLASAFLAWRDEFEALAASHEQPQIGNAELLFIVLGCFSLDWDGLELTEERGYRDGAQRTLDGRSFTPWAKEKGVAVSLKGLYWGSHSSGSPLVLTTFGDHDALPRFGLPDMLWNSGGAFSHYEHLQDGQQAASRLLAKYMADAMADAASVMLVLGEKDLSLQALAARTGIENDRLERMLALLEEAGYVTRQDGTYAGRVLVLGPEDGEMVRDMVAKGREIMIAWHEANYDDVREALSDLTPLRNGVPFGRVYNEVWHFIFGIANRELVKAGLFADPYAESRRHKGFLPFIWTNELSSWMKIGIRQ